MIVQITMTRNECFLLKELLPLWQRYADGFVFYNHFSDDDTAEFLENNKEKYNILSIVNPLPTDDVYAPKEADDRQRLFDEAIKFSNKIICMDSDEYLDGTLSKPALESILDKHPDTLFYCQWTQYASKNTLRVDGEWSRSFNDRLGNYVAPAKFPFRTRHSLHLPPAQRVARFNPDELFIAHLQWIDKRWVGIKQYFWKVTDYVMKHQSGFTDVVGKEAYDNSVNNFAWDYASAPFELKVREDIFKTQDVKTNFKLKEIIRLTNMYDIPNLGDWGMGIYDYAKQFNSK